jgi:hypothetical protein
LKEKKKWKKQRNKQTKTFKTNKTQINLAKKWTEQKYWKTNILKGCKETHKHTDRRNIKIITKQTNRQTGKQIGEVKTNEYKNVIFLAKQTNRQTDKQINKETNKQTDRYKNLKDDEKTDVQTDGPCWSKYGRLTRALPVSSCRRRFNNCCSQKIFKFEKKL